MIQLQVHQEFYNNALQGNFNSSMIQLQAMGLFRKFIVQNAFQFLNDTITSWWGKAQYASRKRHFNSSMIQLQEVYISDHNTCTPFQFLNDTITSLIDWLLYCIEIYFNSSMIQLQVSSGIFMPWLLHSFQFLNDTITSRVGKFLVIHCKISIPQWYNYKALTQGFSLDCREFQFLNDTITSRL